MYTYEMSKSEYERWERIIHYQENGDIVASQNEPRLPDMTYREAYNLRRKQDYVARASILPSRHKNKIENFDEYPSLIILTDGLVFRNHIEVGDMVIDIGDQTNLIAHVNDKLGEIKSPKVVTKLNVIEEPVPRLIISNGHVSVNASRAIWDRENQQLVAATLVSSAKMSIKAVLATLATNSNEWIRLSGSGDNAISLQNAKRGYLQQKHKMESSYATTIFHPVCGDPRQFQEPYFYSIGEGQPFIDRLQTALPWPIKRDWYEYVIEKGQIIGLVDELERMGDFPPSYRVFTGADGEGAGWEDIISAGITGGRLNIQDDPEGPVRCECTPVHTCSACRERSKYINEIPY